MPSTQSCKLYISMWFFFNAGVCIHSLAQEKPSLSYSSFAFVSRSEGFFLGHDFTAVKNSNQFTLRYNYEAFRHLSGYYGFVFAKQKSKYELNVTPMVGVLTNFNKVGGSIGFQGYFFNDSLNLYAYSQAYYISYFKKGNAPLFYNWTEVGYEFGKKNFAGVSYILSKEDNLSYFSAGPFFYKQFNSRLSGSAYALVAGTDRYFLIGGTWAF